MGNTIRKDTESIESKVLDWNYQGSRGTGRPKQTLNYCNWGIKKEERQHCWRLDGWYSIGSDRGYLLIPYAPISRSLNKGELKILIVYITLLQIMDSKSLER